MGDSPSVVDGKIIRLSVSQVEGFDETRTFGCELKWWLTYVAGQRPPPSKSQALGQSIHSEIEAALKHDTWGALGRTARAGQTYLELAAISQVEVDLPPGSLISRGIPFVGRIDAISPSTVFDWKTTYSLEYAKTSDQLLHSIQMLGYAHAVWNANPTWGYWLPKQTQGARLVLGYFQTGPDGPAFRPVETHVDRDQVAEFWKGPVEEIVARMERVAQIKNAGDVKPNFKSCQVGRTTCPHARICPHYKPPAPEEDHLMSAFSSFFPKTTQPTSGVLAPDAPKSDPAKAADPVEGFTPPHPPEGEALKSAVEQIKAALPPEAQAQVEQTLAAAGVETAKTEAPPKRGPGRPRKNPEGAPKPPTVTRLVIRRGMKFRVEGYDMSDHSVEAEMTGSWATSEELAAAKAELSRIVSESLVEEMKPALEARAAAKARADAAKGAK